MKGTSTQYGRLAASLHWLSALIIIFMAVAGYVMVRFVDGPVQTTMYQAHILSGYVVLLLTMIRVVWAFLDTRPQDPEGLAGWNRAVFIWNHYLLYLMLFVVAATGILMLVQSGITPATFSPDAIQDVPPRQGHMLFSRVFMVLLLLHIAGTVRYQMTKGNTFGRIGVPWFSQT